MKNFIITITLITLTTCLLPAQNGVYLSSGSSLHNSIVWGNMDTLSVKRQVSGSGTVSYSAIENSGITGNGNLSLTENPFVGKAVTGFDEYAVVTGATINAGNDEIANSTKDASGYDRKWGHSVDMGAYEYQFPRTVAIIAEDTYKVKGAVDPPLDYSLQGDALLKNDELEVLLVRAQGEEVSAYVIDTLEVKVLRPGAGMDVTHLYALDFQTGVFTITIADGLFDISKAAPINVYPSITNGILYIDGIKERADIFVCDLGGKILIHKELSGVENTLDISALKAGTFIVRISEKEKIETKKVIKK